MTDNNDFIKIRIDAIHIVLGGGAIAIDIEIIDFGMILNNIEVSFFNDHIKVDLPINFSPGSLTEAPTIRFYDCSKWPSIKNQIRDFVSRQKWLMDFLKLEEMPE